MDDEERMARAAIALEAEAILGEHGVYWLSFADESGWLGGCMVEADGPISAVRESHRLGINPGGEVRMMGPVPREVLPEEQMNRLLTKEDLGEDAMRWPEVDE